MSSHAPYDPRSPWPLWLLGALAMTVLVVVGLARWGGWTSAGQDAAVQWSRALYFEDHASGAVQVRDARSGEEVARFEGEQGFLRGSLRALIRERKRRELGPEEPFILQSHADGRLTLRDPTTGSRIPLDSFGPSNLALFMPLRGDTFQISARSQGVKP